MPEHSENSDVNAKDRNSLINSLYRTAAKARKYRCSWKQSMNFKFENKLVKTTEERKILYSIYNSPNVIRILRCNLCRYILVPFNNEYPYVCI